MSGIEVYGLRRAKRIARLTRVVVQGEQDAFAKGFRLALHHVISQINTAINTELNKSPKSKP